MACSAHVAKELATIRLKQAELLERVNQARPAAAHYSFELRALSRTHASNHLFPPQQEVALTETKHTALHSTELVGASEFLIACTVCNIASLATRYPARPVAPRTSWQPRSCARAHCRRSGPSQPSVPPSLSCAPHSPQLRSAVRNHAVRATDGSPVVT